MTRRWLVALGVLWCCAGTAMADDMPDACEVTFKSVVVTIQQKPNAPLRDFGPWSDQLKRGVDANPRSPWADDAEYLAHMLRIDYYAKHPEQSIEAVTQLLQRYPQFDVEPWSTVHLPFFFRGVNQPDVSQDGVILELLLIASHAQIGDLEGAKRVCEQAIQTFPGDGDRFRRLLGGINRRLSSGSTATP